MRRADLSPAGSVFLILWLSSNLDSEAALARYGLYSPKSIYVSYHFSDGVRRLSALYTIMVS